MGPWDRRSVSPVVVMSFLIGGYANNAASYCHKWDYAITNMGTPDLCDNGLGIIEDLPDVMAATAASHFAEASGAGRAKATVLLTPQTVDEAVGRTVDYQPPGT